MADTQYNPLGQENAPAKWIVPGSLVALLKNVYASYDGTGAAGSYVPCLRLVTDSGHIEGEYVGTDTVAAGASADVTWFRGVKPKSGGGSTFTGLKWAQIGQTGFMLATTGFNTVAADFGAAVVNTNDATYFDSALTGGVNTLRILKTGTYLCWGSINLATNGVPPAGSLLQCIVTPPNSDYVGGNLYAPYENIGGGAYGAGVDHSTITVISTPPGAVFLDVGQNTGLSQPGSVYLGVVRLAD